MVPGSRSYCIAVWVVVAFGAETSVRMPSTPVMSRGEACNIAVLFFFFFGEMGDEYIYLRMHDISCWLGEDQEQKRKPFSAAKKNW